MEGGDITESIADYLVREQTAIHTLVVDHWGDKKSLCQ